jgi:hypothetical protein
MQQKTPVGGLTVEALSTQASFIEYLKNHPKSKKAVVDLQAGKFAQEARRHVTHVAVSKLVDIFGNRPPSNIKTKVSTWLAELTQMNTSDYFDSKTHKGFLSKNLENRRRKLPPEEKKWVWTKKIRFEDTGVTDVTITQHSDSTSSSHSDENDHVDVDGCPRGFASCNFCTGTNQF